MEMRFLRIVSMLILMLLINMQNLLAQCPMCKAAAESSIESGSTMALGLNSGILYLLLMPYILIAVVAGVWYYNYKKKVVNS